MATGIAELEKIVAKIGISMNELAESQKITELALQETQRVLQETRLDLSDSLQEMSDSLQETRRDLRNSLQETRRDLRNSLKELSSNVGGVNQRLGEIVEMVVLPGLMKGFNDLGHKFTMSSPRKRFTKNGKQLVEIDLMLENCDEVMAVEAKTRFKEGEMNEFLKHLEILRKNEKITGVAGKTIYAAAAGIGFDPTARKIAVKNGVYIVNINTDYDNEKLKIIPPAKGAVGKW